MKNINCILLIDDDDDDNEYHSLIIKRAGICNSIKVVTSGDEALDYFNKCGEVNNLPDYPKPDLVYLDINMPGMNGFEFLDKYRRLDEASKSSVVIIMLSTSLNPSDKRRVMELTEVKEFQNKPLSVVELKRTIDAYYPDTTETSEVKGEIKRER